MKASRGKLQSVVPVVDNAVNNELNAELVVAALVWDRWRRSARA